MKKHYRHEHDCLNCGSELQGKFCHNCGQENLQIKESFGHMVNHAVSDYFHFDQQFFHTLKPLLFQPGKLTIEYMAGRRAQYLHPVKMYIFISLVYFVLLFKSNHEVVRKDPTNRKSKKELAKDIKKDLDKNANLTENQKKSIEKTVSKYVPNAQAIKITENGDISPVKVTDDGSDMFEDSTYAQYKLKQSKLPVAERDGFWERFYNKAGLAYKEKYGAHYKDMFMEDVKHNVPKMMFVLLPLFAMILRFTFWRNHKYYVEHMIYAIHLHCFFFLFSAIILLIQLILPHSWETTSDWLNVILFLYTLYYIYRSLRILYIRTRWVTIGKMITMSFWYWLMFCICGMGMVMIVAAQAG